MVADHGLNGGNIVEVHVVRVGCCFFLDLIEEAEDIGLLVLIGDVVEEPVNLE